VRKKLLFSIDNKTGQKISVENFGNIKEAILGKRYELSLVFIGSKFSKKLNRIYRKKNQSTNILSFPLSNPPTGGSGEIFIDLEQSKKEFKKFDLTFPNFITFLFIHGLLHLKGMEHGSTMEQVERKFYQKFKHGSLNRRKH